MKDTNLTVQKTGKRIMIFGDSFTEGVGAPNDSAYPRLLEKLVQAKTDSPVQVINCGISGADIFTEYELFNRKMLKYQPDLVIVTFNSSDFNDFFVRGGFERFISPDKVRYRDAPWFEPLYAKSFIVRRIVHDVFKYDRVFIHPREYAYQNNLANNAINAGIDSFNNLCQANRIKFGIIFQPCNIEITKFCIYPMEPLIAHCQRYGIAHKDEFAFLNENKIDSASCKNIYWVKDGHFNPMGYELLAKCAYEFYVEKLK